MLNSSSLVRRHTEVELLLCCARICLDAASTERISILVHEDIDWAYLIGAAYWHRVMPLLYRNLHTVAPTALPQTALHQLRQDFYSNAWHNLQRSNALVTILQLFEQHHIPAIPYKGPVLAASVYGSLAFRMFADIDILVPKQAFVCAKDLLISQGYSVKNRPRYAREYTLISHDKKVMVDLHWGLTGWAFPFPVDLTRWWERLEPVTLAGTAVVRSFSPPDLLLYLCVNGSKDGWSTLACICDVAELLRVSPQMDWEQIIGQANTLRIQRLLFLGLSLAHNLLGVALPEPILQRMNTDAVPGALATQIQQRLFSDTDGTFMGLDGTGFGFRIRESLQHRVLCLCCRLHARLIGFPDQPVQTRTPNEKERLLRSFPGFPSVFWHMLRPIRLFRKYGLQPLKYLFWP